MSTIKTKIDDNGHINIGSVVEAAAIQLFNAPHLKHGGINHAYELAEKQPNVFKTDVPMSDIAGVGLYTPNNKVLVSCALPINASAWIGITVSRNPLDRFCKKKNPASLRCFLDRNYRIPSRSNHSRLK